MATSTETSNPAPPITLADEERHCNTLLKFWDAVAVQIITAATCDKYRDWRKQRVQQGNGDRAIDRELNTLINAFRYCKRREVASANPVADRPRYQPSTKVHPRLLTSPLWSPRRLTHQICYLRSSNCDLGCSPS